MDIGYFTSDILKRRWGGREDCHLAVHGLESLGGAPVRPYSLLLLEGLVWDPNETAKHVKQKETTT